MPEQQSRLVVQRTRRHQIAIINSIRAHLAEFGIGGRVGRRGVEKLIADSNEVRIPIVARVCIAALGVQFRQLKTQILELKRLERQAWQRPDRKRGTLKKSCAPGLASRRSIGSQMSVNHGPVSI
jgi:transposase